MDRWHQRRMTRQIHLCFWSCPETPLRNTLAKPSRSIVLTRVDLEILITNGLAFDRHCIAKSKIDDVIRLHLRCKPSQRAQIWRTDA